MILKNLADILCVEKKAELITKLIDGKLSSSIYPPYCLLRCDMSVARV